MSSEVAIRVENLGKRYRLGELNHNRSLREQLCKWLSWPLRRGKPDKPAADPADKPIDGNILWALREVNFEIRRGDVVGFVGSNGAGKSTLLKILSRIIEPTEGSAEIRGRVGSLLEVGTGFHQELTGRENVFLNGAILGMDRGEIRNKFDEIVDFAGVEAFIDTPVKRYSSGMTVRLAFAVAAHLDPQILIIDEVLAVGDAAFQRKCLGKMGDVARDGRTVLFVSHNIQAVTTLCNRAMLMDQGRLVMQDEPLAVARRYAGSTNEAKLDHQWDDPATAPGNDWIRLHRARIVPENGVPPEDIDLHTPFLIEFWYWNLKPNTRLNLSLVLRNAEQVCAFVSVTIHEPDWHAREFPMGLFRSTCAIPGNLLNNGQYSVELLFVKDQFTVVYSHPSIVVFDVREFDRNSSWFGKWIGVVRPELAWTTQHIGTEIECYEPYAA